MGLQENLDRFAGLDVQPLVVMIEPLDVLTKEASARGIARIPILSDSNTRVTSAYGALGTGMHADKPGHTFVLIDKDGAIIWRQTYAGENLADMFVANETVIGEVTRALQADR